MDIVSHGIWAGFAAKGANKKFKKPLNPSLAFFFGVFPDLFAFTLPFIFLLWNIIFNGVSISSVQHSHSMEGTPQDSMPLNNLTLNLYKLSHSFIIFILVFLIVFLILKRPVFEMFGWLMHILMDIPTHTYKFFPTPFLWPFSDFKISGFSWATPWFMILNYSAIVFVYLILRFKKNNKSVRPVI